MSTKRVLLVGGGSGGHFYPLMAISEALQKEAKKKSQTPPELYYMGPERYDQKSLDELGITFISCPAGKSRRYSSVKNFFDTFRNVVR